eukprot:442493-Pleurochrysis_carterae.AAC.2
MNQYRIQPGATNSSACANTKGNACKEWMFAPLLLCPIMLPWQKLSCPRHWMTTRVASQAALSLRARTSGRDCRCDREDGDGDVNILA